MGKNELIRYGDDKAHISVASDLRDYIQIDSLESYESYTYLDHKQVANLIGQLVEWLAAWIAQV